MSPSWEFLLDTLWRWHLCQGFRAKQFFLLCLLFPRGIGEESQEGPDTPRGEPPPQGAGHQRGAFACLETNSAPGSSAVQTLRKLCQPARSCWFLCSLSVPLRFPAKALALGLALGLGRRPLQCPLVAYVDLTVFLLPHSETVKTTSRSFCHSTAATCSPVARQPSAPCVPTL